MAAIRSRTEEEGSRSASARQVAETGLSPRRLAGFLEATTEGFVLHKSPPCVLSMDSIGSRMPARVSRPLHHHGPRPAPMTKRNPAPFHWGSPSSPDTLTPVEASPSSLTTHNLEAPREETSLAACSRRFKFKLSRVPAPLRQSRAPPPIVTTKEMASITDIGHVHVLSPSGPRFRRVCRVVVVVMEVVQFSGTCAPPPTSKPHQCVCCVYFYHPDRLSWELSHEEICRNNEIEPV